MCVFRSYSIRRHKDNEKRRKKQPSGRTIFDFRRGREFREEEAGEAVIKEEELRLGAQLAKGPLERTQKRRRDAGLMGRAKLGTSPQPSGRACTSGPAGRELQPSARGRLRAADVCDVEFAAKCPSNNRRLQAVGRCATQFAAKFLGSIDSCRRPIAA